MQSFYQTAMLGTVRVGTFSGRNTNTPFGIWGAIADDLSRREVLRDCYTPLRAPSPEEWIRLLGGDPILILLDELPPYFDQARAFPVGATTLDTITTTAISNLLVAIGSGRLPNACLVLTDLRSSAYSAGSSAVVESLRNLELEVNRSVVRIDPVRLNTNEVYHILQTRLFEQAPNPADAQDVADAYCQVLEDAQRIDLATASPQQLRADIVSSYPFHPAIRDLYARFRENSGFQQTRALIRIMRRVVAQIWDSGRARHQYLIGAQNFDLHDPGILSEIRQINNSLENAIAHDIAAENGSSVAEQLDGPDQNTAQDAARLIFLSSLSQAINPTLGLTRSEIVAYGATPQSDLSRWGIALDQLQAQSWYVHPTAAGALLFKNTENLGAKLESYARGMLHEVRESELRAQLNEMFKPKLAACYQEINPLPALDRIQLIQDKVTLVVFRPGVTVLDEIKRFFDLQQYQNRVLFLTGQAPAYDTVLQRSAELKAIRVIIQEFKAENRSESDPQFQDAMTRQTTARSKFYLACRETFQTLYYPTLRGLTPLELSFEYSANSFEGENQIVNELESARKYTKDTSADTTFPTSVENRLWPAEVKEVKWTAIKQAAASNPAWVWHHPRALDDLHVEMVRRDLWRDVGDGFVQRGPFPQPATTVAIQQQSRDDNTGEVILRITPRHADMVYMSETGPATTISSRLQDFTFKTRALTLSFLAVDSTNQHDTGDPVTWRNTITLKYRFFQDGGQRKCEIQAIPLGDILYTIDGSSPVTSGIAYSQPFSVPVGALVILATASAGGVDSPQLRVDVPHGSDTPTVTVDPRRPATWRKVFRKDSTAEVYEWLELLAKHNAGVGGLKMEAGKENSWVELRVDDKTIQSVADLRSIATLLRGIIPSGNLSCSVETLHFSQGQDLTEMVATLRETMQPGEVIQ
jgi:hypothetical protein